MHVSEDDVDDGEEEEEGPPSKRRKSSAIVTKKESQGALLVQPYVSAILTYIEGAVNTLGAQLKEKSGKERVNKESLLELKILAR